MDFFKHQEIARRKSGLLVFYYILAVILIVASIYAVYTLIFVYFQMKSSADAPAQSFNIDMLFNYSRLILVTIVTLSIVLLGTLYKTAQLSSGGQSVAVLLGGRPIAPATKDLSERKILNVVEEMAIASGVPVPRVFVLDNEEAINAFAAGFRPQDAVIGVTRGCITKLTRNELQGVIGHEFSHILNGDMKLNINLTGLIHGILVIALIGYFLFRSLAFSRGSSKDKGGGAAIAIFGLAIMIIGYIGVFFGKLIKSAVSRQREYLADASAVQFTRDTSGIAGALKKIGGLEAGSKLESRNAEQASHFFFANGLSRAWFSLMATHPPLPERISRLDPSFNGDFPKISEDVSEEESAVVSGFTNSKKKTIDLNVEEVIAGIGVPTSSHLDYVTRILSDLPAEMREDLKNADGAETLIYALLLNKETVILKSQIGMIEKNAAPAIVKKMVDAISAIDQLDLEMRMPLAELAVSTLKTISKERFKLFTALMNELVNADAKVDLFEYTLQQMVLHRLVPLFEKARPLPLKYSSITPLVPFLVNLISSLAYEGSSDPAEARRFFKSTMQKINPSLEIKSRSSCGISSVDAALKELSLAVPAVKKEILEACVRCVVADGEVTIGESELIRAVSDALDCPMPPFLAGKMK